MKPQTIAETFAKKYGDKAVWQVDTLLVKMARIIELEIILPLFQGGETQLIIQAELNQLKKGRAVKYVTLEGLELHNRFITPYDPARDTPESIIKLADGTTAYKLLGFHESVKDAQIAIYGRAYPLPGEK